MRKKLLFIFNPRSGKGRIKNALFELMDLFTRVGYDVMAHPTQTPEDCSETVVRLAEDFDVLAVSGGDGTLNEAVTGMLMIPEEKRIPIGYIPSGTMNDFANGNGIPKDIVSAAKTLIGGDTKEYDIGKFNEKKFIYVAVSEHLRMFRMQRLNPPKISLAPPRILWKGSRAFQK